MLRYVTLRNDKKEQGVCDLHHQSLSTYIIPFVYCVDRYVYWIHEAERIIFLMAYLAQKHPTKRLVYYI